MTSEAMPAPTTTDPAAEAPTADTAPRSRRAILAAAVGGALASVATALGRPGETRAAAGSPMILGQANDSGTSQTTLTNAGTGAAFTLKTTNASTGATGIFGWSSSTAANATRGVYGRADGANSNAVVGIQNGAAGSGSAVLATGGNNVGLTATTSSTNKAAVSGAATATAANDSSNVTARGVSGSAEGDGAFVLFIAIPSAGVYGINSYDGAGGTIAAGVWGDATGGNSSSAVRALHYGSGAGILASSISGLAGSFSGDVAISGDLSVSGTVSKGGGSFRIDHPLDPANKYLVHSFVESPEMLNVYSGNATTDAHGKASVRLPAWFSAVNGDLRYQLTTIGQAQAWVEAEVSGDAFSIATDKPHTKVSWQVSGVRTDAWANANRIEVEMAKTGAAKGRYLHPELHGKGADQAIHYDKVTAMAREAVKTHGQAKAAEILRANAGS